MTRCDFKFYGNKVFIAFISKDMIIYRYQTVKLNINFKKWGGGKYFFLILCYIVNNWWNYEFNNSAIFSIFIDEKCLWYQSLNQFTILFSHEIVTIPCPLSIIIFILMFNVFIILYNKNLYFKWRGIYLYIGLYIWHIPKYRSMNFGANL